MNNLIPTNLVIGDRTYRVKIHPKDEEDQLSLEPESSQIPGSKTAALHEIVTDRTEKVESDSGIRRSD